MGQNPEAEGSICPFLVGVLSFDWSWFLSKESWLGNLDSLAPSLCISFYSLVKCDLDTSAYKELASLLLLSSKKLKKLTLSKNALSRDGMQVFCDALFHRDCVLESLV